MIGGGAQARAPRAATIDLGEAFRVHRGAVTAAAVRVLRRRDDIDDLVQDVFVEALRGVHALREPAALRAWLTRVAVRVATRRRGPARFLGLDDVPDAAAVADPRASPVDLALLAAVGELLAALPAEQRRAWAMRIVDGEELDDIAHSCGCSRTTIKRRIAEVQQILHEGL